MIGMEGFGASAPGERLFEEFKLTPAHIADTVRRLLSEGSTKRTGKDV
jgi:transketolase